MVVVEEAQDQVQSLEDSVHKDLLESENAFSSDSDLNNNNCNNFESITNGHQKVNLNATKSIQKGN